MTDDEVRSWNKQLQQIRSSHKTSKLVRRWRDQGFNIQTCGGWSLLRATPWVRR